MKKFKDLLTERQLKEIWNNRALRKEKMVMINTEITRDVKTSSKGLRWYHGVGLVTPKCPECKERMAWEELAGYGFYICGECQIIRD